MPDPSQLLDAVKAIIPKLSGEPGDSLGPCKERHKGQAGKIAVIGGCREYTGAPFFSAFSALKIGADIAHVFCTQGAATVIKGYSPELIVHPYLPDSQEQGSELSKSQRDELVERAVAAITEWLGRFDAIVIGPGLGRDTLVLSVASQVMRQVTERGIPLVIDADGLWMVNSDVSLVQGKDCVVLTPNVVEFKRLATAVDVDASARDAAARLAAVLQGPVVLQKGRADLAADGDMQLECTEPGSLRRVGGQGDVLSGCLATLLAWARGAGGSRNTSAQAVSPLLLACYGSSLIVRKAAKAAYGARGRAMGAPDVVDCLGPVVDAMVGEGP